MPLGEYDQVIDLHRTDEMTNTRAAMADRYHQLQIACMADGATTLDDIAAATQQPAAEIEQWVQRCVSEHRLIAVVWEQQTIVPTCLLDQDRQPIAGWQPILKALAEDETTGWDAWIWLANQSTWLDDHKPVDTFGHDPDLLLAAIAARIESRNI